MNSLFKTTFTLFLLCSVFQANAQTASLSIQGILRIAEGNAVDNGKYDLTFRLYVTPTIGDVLWEEIIENVDVKGGVYSVVLGAGDTPLDVNFDVPYYLGVSVDGGVEMQPRARLTSAPYALSLIGNDNVFPSTGNVGVGAASPQHKFTLQKGDGILGLEAVEDANNTTVITTTADGMSFDAGGTDKIYAFPNGRIDATANEQFTIEGTDTSQLVLTNTTGSATLGFDAANGDDLKLSNSIGKTEIEGSNIELTATNGPATIEGNGITLNPTNEAVQINKDGETLKLQGTNSCAIAFSPHPLSSANGLVGFFDHSLGDVHDLSIYNQTPDKKIILRASGTNGYIDVKNRMNVTSSISYYGSHQYFNRSIRENSHDWSPAGTYHVSIYTTHDIMTKGILLYSDKRIKKDFRLSSGLNDLQTLQQIEVTDYKHQDVVAHGTKFTKGFIAQQVRDVFEEAVTLGPGEIPSIYTFPLLVEKNVESTKIVLDKPHDLKVGDQVKFVLENTNETLAVSKVINATTFEIEGSDIDINEKTFVFGKAIDDFHSIDYDRIYTLNVSATQELARKVEALEKENAALKRNSQESNDTIQELKAEMESLKNWRRTFEN